jgi:hypothetical protein
LPIHSDFSERIDKEADMVKAQYFGGLFQLNYNEHEHMHIGVQVVIALFHFKKLSVSLMLEYKRTYLENESDIFRTELDAQINKSFAIIKMDFELEQFACAFFKFFLLLTTNPILAKSEKWNKYIRFRMRHFYWIDLKVCTFIRTCVAEDVNPPVIQIIQKV